MILENTSCSELRAVADKYKELESKVQHRIVFCAGTGCIANGALGVHDALVEKIAERGINALTELKKESLSVSADNTHVSQSGCQGFCQMGPLITIYPADILYVKVKPEDVDEIVEKTLIQGEIVERLLYHDPSTDKTCKGHEEIPFYNLQKRTVLKECGLVDPRDLNEYISRGGYNAAFKAITAMSPKIVCDEVLASGLRGRGGGGFPTGRKWHLTREQKSTKKYVICNGDEGDPGAFMDRSIMEGNPHAVIEGMLVAARAIGADEGYVYVRTEYPLAVSRIRKAVEDAEKKGLLGEKIFGTDFNFKLHVMEGAGAFVCGEETALMASIEGHRGMPMPKPPFPAQQGLGNAPTVINNVETLASIPLIIDQGVAKFRENGTETSPGTKTFALTGHVANTGLIEVPFGTTLRRVVIDIGGGVIDNKNNLTGKPFKAVQIGGPSGGCLTEKDLDLPLDFDSLIEAGAMVGSGGLVVMNQDTCMVQVARFFMQFTQNESCGKCIPCREGTKQMLAMLDDIINGDATEDTIVKLEQLGRVVMKGSLCGLGKTAPSPVLSTLKHFRAEVEAHVFQKRCPAGKCKALALPEILEDKCIGCTKCARVCPVGAISGERKQLHHIDPETCVKCGVCAANCKFDAIIGVS